MIASVRPALAAHVVRPLTDDEVDARYACEHRFVPMVQAEGYGMCEACGVMMWMQIEMVYCNWLGAQLEGRV